MTTAVVHEVEPSTTDGGVQHLFCLPCVLLYDDHLAICGAWVELPVRPLGSVPLDKCYGCVQWAVEASWPVTCKRGHVSGGIE